MSDLIFVQMAPESISIATCIDAIFPNLPGDQRQTICDKLKKEFIVNQEDLKDYIVDELHVKVKVPLHAAKKLESSGLLKVPAAPTGTKSNFVVNINSVDFYLRVICEEGSLTDMVVCDVYGNSGCTLHDRCSSTTLVCMACLLCYC